MTKIGVRGFYQITEEIESALLSDENVNTVTTGDITDIDLSKNSIYPISHVTVNNANLEYHITLDLKCLLGIVDIVLQVFRYL